MEQKIQIHQGQITIQLEGLDIKIVERYRATIHELLTKGVFDIKNGKVMLHFDKEGNLGQVDLVGMVLWKR